MSRINSKVLRRIAEIENNLDNHGSMTTVAENIFCGCVHLPLCHHGRFPLDIERARNQAGFYLDCAKHGVSDITLTCEDLRPRDLAGKLIPKTSRTLQKVVGFDQ